MHITISGRIPSKKNSKRRTGRRLIASSKYIEWEKTQIDALTRQGVDKLGLGGPLEVQYVFYFPDKRRTDIGNKIESINDMLVEYGLFLDDHCGVIEVIKAKFAGVDKDNPRCELQIKPL